MLFVCVWRRARLKKNKQANPPALLNSALPLSTLRAFWGEGYAVSPLMIHDPP